VHEPENATGVVLPEELTDERAAGDVGLLLTQPAAELDGGPVELASEGGIVGDGQDLGLDGGRGEFGAGLHCGDDR
jgi:hypothetical protein